MRLASLAFLAMLTLPYEALSEAPSDISAYRRVLVPIRTNVPVMGLYGSIWETELVALNTSDQALVIRQGDPWTCTITTCPAPVGTEPGVSFMPYSSPAPGNPGAVFFVEKTGSQIRDVWFSLVLHERSMNRATELPVIHEEELFLGRITLPRVPISIFRRAALRIYDPFNQPDTAVAIEARNAETGADLFTTVLELRPAESPDPPSEFDFHPAYADIGDVRTFLPPGFTGTVQITIAAHDDRPIWAFVSLTDTVTQEVQIVTPQ